MSPAYSYLSFAMFIVFALTQIPLFAIGALVLAVAAAAVSFHEYLHPRQ